MTENTNVMEHFDSIMNIIQRQYNDKRYLRAPEMQEIQNLAQKFKSEIINVLTTKTTTQGAQPNSPTNTKSPQLNSFYNHAGTRRDTAKPRETYAKIVVKSNEKFRSSSHLENSVAKVINDHEIKATIQSCRPTHTGDIQIHFNANDDVHLIANAVSHNLGIQASGRPPLSPKISISHIPHHIAIENIKEEIFKSNQFLNDSKDEEFKVLFEYDRQDVHTVVCKVSPNLRHEIMRNGGKLTIDCRNCPVRDRIHVTRCTKCNHFGHTRSNCSEGVETCSFCAKQHSANQCPNKQDSSKYKCINCSNSEHNNNHPAHHSSCPTYLRNRQRIISRTDWGKSGPPQL